MRHTRLLIVECIVIALSLLDASRVKSQTPLEPPLPQGTFYQKGRIVSQQGIGVIGCTSGEYINGDASGCTVPVITNVPVPIAQGGTGSTTAQGAATNIVNGNAISPSSVTVGPSSSDAMTFSQTRGVAGFVTPELYGAYGNGTTDDAAAIQACWDASASSGLICRLDASSVSIYGTHVYLANGQLTLRQNTNVEGNSQTGAGIQSEYNGPAVVMAAGPVQGVVLRDFSLILDKTLANSAGFYLVAQAGGSANNGGLWYSNFKNITIVNPAKECMRLDGGGAEPGYDFLTPNQADQFEAISCYGPTGQAHPAALLEISGQTGQVVFRDGVLNGDATSTGTGTGTTYTYYPNALVLLQQEGGTFGNVAPGNVTFSNQTAEYGQIGYSLQFASNITINGGSHAEALGTFITMADTTATVHNDYFGNVGTTAVGVVSGGSLSLKNNTYTADGTHPIASLVNCSNYGTAFVENNYIGAGGGGGSILTSTSNCATIETGVASSMTLSSSEALVDGDGGATPISTLIGPVAPGGTISLLAHGNSFKLASGGNISFGSFTSPLSIPQNSSVTLRLFDYGASWLVESVNGTIGGIATGTIVTAGAPTVGQATCVKSLGPPIVIGYCSTVVAAGGACTCN